MGHDQRGAGTKFDREIAVADGIERVLADFFKSQQLGDRLAIEWNVADDAGAVLVPAMVLQPLMENAVYHGVEPGVGTGTVEIVADVSGDALHVVLTNPYKPDHQHRQGNRMALDNIRERLQLHFDVDARLVTHVAGERFVISIVMPYRKESRVLRAAQSGKPP